MKVRSAFLVTSALAASVACGSSKVSGFTPTPDAGSSGGLGGGTDNTLVVDPINAILFLDTATKPVTHATQAYTVTRRLAAGDKDVTANATFSLDQPEIGAFAGANFESGDSLPAGARGMTSNITVGVDTLTTNAAVTVVQLRKTGDQRDFFFIEPYNGTPTPSEDVLKFKTNIQQVDVAFVIDTTGSMSGEINGIRTALAGSLLTQLQAAIPSVAMSIVSHKDDSDGAELVQVLQPLTTSLTAAQAAVNALTPSGGGDLPEGQVSAMYHVLTGDPLGTLIPKHTPAPGTTGGVDFRPGAVPVVVLTTDATWHDPSVGITAGMLAAQFLSKNVRFVSLASGDETQANSLSDTTDSHLPTTAFTGCSPGLCCTGINGADRFPDGPGTSCRLNFKYDKSSPNLGKGVVDAIKAISVGSSYDVAARPRNDASNPNGVDATKFIKSLRAKDEGDAVQGCAPHDAKDTNGDGIKDTFTAVTVGTPVCFEVLPAVNDFVPPEKGAQFFNAFIDVVGIPGDINLDQRSVLFLVPPKDPSVK